MRALAVSFSRETLVMGDSKEDDVVVTVLVTETLEASVCTLTPDVVVTFICDTDLRG